MCRLGVERRIKDAHAALRPDPREVECGCRRSRVQGWRPGSSMHDEDLIKRCNKSQHLEADAESEASKKAKKEKASKKEKKEKEKTKRQEGRQEGHQARQS